MSLILTKVYLKIRKFFDRPKFEQLPENLRKLSGTLYSIEILKYPYKSDKMKGLLDKTSSISHFLDKKVKSDRDCDDFARMWSAWLIYNGYKATEIFITNPKHFFRNAHFITIGEKDGKFILCNYFKYGPFYTFDRALNKMKIFPSYSNYVYTIYRTFEPINK